jgi:hypothetical protein
MISTKGTRIRFDRKKIKEYEIEKKIKNSPKQITIKKKMTIFDRLKNHRGEIEKYL